MITEERYGKILKCVNENTTITVSKLVEILGASESTIRRDLNALDEMGKLIKVHGGATAKENSFSFEEQSVEAKEKMNASEKEKIAEYAASTIRKDDFVFIDAGTTTYKMIDFITEKDVSFVTNGFTHAKKLAARGYKVYLVGGQIKASTEAIVGADTVRDIERYNFTKCYLGANGISLTGGFTTPDVDEANVKTAVASNSYITYVLADHSKFDKVSSVTFMKLNKACVITDKIVNDKYKDECVIKEVLE